MRSNNFNCKEALPHGALPYLKEKHEKLFGICQTEMRKFDVISK